MKNLSAYHQEDFLRNLKLTLMLILVPLLRELWPFKHRRVFFGTPCMLLSNEIDMNTYVSFSMSVSRNLLLLRKSCVYIKTVDGHKFENQNFEILFILNLQVSSLTRSMVEPSTTALSYSGILTRTKKKDSGAVRMTSV